MAVSVEPPNPDPQHEIARLQAALQREVRISRALREVGVALGTTLDLDDLLELILGRLTELLDADRSTLYLVDEARGDLVSRVTIGAKVRSIRVKIGHGIAGTVAKTGEPIRLRDVYRDPRFEAEWDVLTGYRTTCLLAAPLKNHLGRTIGVIQVLNKADGEFTDEDEAILSALSTQAAVAIDNSRLFLSLIQKNRQLLDTKEQLERRVKDLQFLFELERATSRAQTLDSLISAALSTAAKACDAGGAALLLASDELQEWLQYIYDDESGQVSRVGVAPGEGMLSAAMADVRVLNLKDAGSDERFSERVDGALPSGSLMAMQLDGDQRVLGVIAVLGKRGALQFGQEDESLLRMVSANVSTALRLFFANEERERSARLTSIGRLLSQVIHDFKTPMTVISGYVQLMQNEDDPRVRAEHTKQALRQFDVLTAMQREVLEFARGERSLFVRRVYLHKFFADIRQQLTLEVDGRAIDVEMDVDNKLVARFDEARVARAVHNLCRNAIEAMAERGGVLRIEARMDQDELLIAVSDTGPGIPEEVRGRLFQSFVTAGKRGGTGLGLAIVKKTMDEHGGRVEVSSGPTGACFELRFPQEPLLSKKAPRPVRPVTAGTEPQAREPATKQPTADPH